MAIADTDRFSIPRSTGVTRPVPVAMATETSTVRNRRTASGCHTAFISGTWVCAVATALISRSLTEILTGLTALIRCRRASSSSTAQVARR